MSQAIVIKVCRGHEGRESAPAAVSVEFQFINFESAQKLMKTNIVGMSELGSTNDPVRMSRCASHVDLLISATCPFVHDFFFSFIPAPSACLQGAFDAELTSSGFPCWHMDGARRYAA